jgi:mannose-6-phosphate isomerase-like protein (cupin superfamily)
MAYAGQVIENPVTGERITFIRTAGDTDGELVAIDLELPPDARVPGMHVHPVQEERFEVLEGTMRFTLGWRKVDASAGEAVVVPAGRRHDFANAGPGTARVRVEIRPALKIERFFETAAALAREGRTLASGLPKPLELALFTREFAQEVQAPFPPPWAVRAALAPLAWLATRRGHGARDAGRPATA